MLNIEILHYSTLIIRYCCFTPSLKDLKHVLQPINYRFKKGWYA
jgi:hypothetical protein